MVTDIAVPALGNMMTVCVDQHRTNRDLIVLTLCTRCERKRMAHPIFVAGYHYSHSIVAGGLPLMSYTTRDTPLSSLTMRRDTVSRKS